MKSFLSLCTSAIFMLPAIVQIQVQAQDKLQPTRPLKEITSECIACHTNDSNSFGPSLKGVYGRQVGSLASYKYSDTLRDLVGFWGNVTLDAYLQKPHRLIPNSKMRHKGLSNPLERKMIINWLKYNSPAEQVKITDLVAGGDTSKGHKIFQACRTCHSYTYGKANKIGPNLYGVMGRDIASAPNFNYSARLQKFSGIWSPISLNRFFVERKGLRQGSHYAFKKLKTQKDRADLIAFLAALK